MILRLFGIERSSDMSFFVVLLSIHKRLSLNFCQQWQQRETHKWGLLISHLGSMDFTCFLHGVGTWAYPLLFSFAPLISSFLQLHHSRIMLAGTPGRARSPSSQAFYPVCQQLCAHLEQSLPPSLSQHTTYTEGHREPQGPSCKHTCSSLSSSKASVVCSCFTCIQSPAILPAGVQLRICNDLAFLTTLHQVL